MLLCKQEEAGFQLNAEQADWRDDTNVELEDQELEPLQKVQNNDDNYNVFAIKCEHPEQPESVIDTYPVEQDEHNIIIDSLDMNYDREQDDQNDNDDLVKERDFLASLIEKLKCEIDDNKNRNKFLETSNKALVDKLKGLELGARLYDSWKLQGDVEELWDELAKLGLGLRCCFALVVLRLRKEVTKQLGDQVLI
ncbi:hypothetical protein Tco_0432950 [Tanacetum coccineum]